MGPGQQMSTPEIYILYIEKSFVTYGRFTSVVWSTDSVKSQGFFYGKCSAYTVTCRTYCVMFNFACSVYKIRINYKMYR